MKLLVVAVLVAMAVSVSAECGPLQKLNLKAQWQRAFSSGHDREHFAVAVMRAVLKQVPELHHKLAEHGADDVGGAKFAANAMRILSNLDIIINLLDQPEALHAHVEYLHKKKGDRHVPEAVKKAFRMALAHVLPAQLGRCFDKEVWKTCYYDISEGFDQE